MDTASITTLITEVGFPIACAVALFYLLWKQSQQHKEESESWIKALDTNTRVLEANTTIMAENTRVMQELQAKLQGVELNGKDQSK